MIEFLTLFLGLTVGAQTVEVGVGDEVASVELVLNGKVVDRVERAPWTLTCDFGTQLEPHELVAIARDREGKELARTRQLVNLPRELAEASLVLLPETPGQGPSARVVWEATDYAGSPSVRVTFDGLPAAVSPEGIISLPPFDPKQIHLLRAEIEFNDALHVQTELVFGGIYAEEVTTELTAVSLVGSKKLPKLSEMQTWFRYGGKAIRAVAVERGSPDLFVVRGRSQDTLEELKRLAVAGHRQWARAASRPAGVLTLRQGGRLRFVFPEARATTTQKGVGNFIFPVSSDLVDIAHGRIDRILTETYFDEDVPSANQQLADAVAIAGVRAAAGNRPRAVVLISDSEHPGSSITPPSQVESYLAKLQVPFFFWRLSLPQGSSRSEEPAVVLLSPDDAWTTPSQEIGDYVDLVQAIRGVLRNLNSQFIVWLDGSFLPNKLEITDDAGKVRFAG